VRKRRASAFSLVELMAVVGVMAILAVVAAPALKGLAGSGGRKQALGQLLGALELARNSAISSGTNAAVIFPDDSVSISTNYMYRSFTVVRWDPTNSAGSNTMVVGWIALPQGISLHPGSYENFEVITNTSVMIPPGVTASNLPSVRGIIFKGDGGLFPETSRATSGVAFFEGQVGAGRAINRSGPQTNFEVIRISRFTGRTRATLVASNQVAP
jgi:Tfp pilus assembly protein FimT